MSTSSSGPSAPPAEVRSLAYPEATLPALQTEASLDFGNNLPESSMTAAEAARREALAHEAGRQEGEAQARAAFEQQLATWRGEIANALSAFARERAAYYQQVEGEVLQLALSIARKVLHRESQVDPLVLAGIVRVTLEKIEAGTEVLVRVHPQAAESWRAYFSAHLDPQDVPQVVDDPALEAQRCVVQTLLGKTEIGLEVQLKEIEQGLCDLLAKRPGGSP